MGHRPVSSQKVVLAEGLNGRAVKACSRCNGWIVRIKTQGLCHAVAMSSTLSHDASSVHTKPAPLLPDSRQDPLIRRLGFVLSLQQIHRDLDNVVATGRQLVRHIRLDLSTACGELGTHASEEFDNILEGRRHALLILASDGEAGCFHIGGVVLGGACKIEVSIQASDSSRKH